MYHQIIRDSKICSNKYLYRKPDAGRRDDPSRKDDSRALNSGDTACSETELNDNKVCVSIKGKVNSCFILNAGVGIPEPMSHMWL